MQHFLVDDGFDDILDIIVIVLFNSGHRCHVWGYGGELYV